MAPPTPTYPLSALTSQINTLPSGKPRKPPIADLTTCPLKALTQYKCNAEKPKAGKKPMIVCAPVVRLFRECANGLHVETTVWEGWNADQKAYPTRTE
ncbi:hypothetical protein K458DRAFT_298421 [Lentithecium fluviatile CBS 122367]|uniref:Mitochondrial export protein Som1 n=1 Tax=Lentithecium fluviatile CBS 122367 TaxID=1168545 RepID=A0A6G1J6C7_9PLEO|nr:hypothetical protein K458DRAFT_298421 [Lentithecium fluviatile CBS 122367]